jgi:hypothetical protein
MSEKAVNEVEALARMREPDSSIRRLDSTMDIYYLGHVEYRSRNKWDNVYDGRDTKNVPVITNNASI